MTQVNPEQPNTLAQVAGAIIAFLTGFAFVWPAIRRLRPNGKKNDTGEFRRLAMVVGNQEAQRMELQQKLQTAQGELVLLRDQNAFLEAEVRRLKGDLS